MRIIVRETLEELTTFGDGGRQPGQFYGVHSIATDSKGNLYTTETYEGKRLQKFVYKGVGTVPRGYQGVLWPKRPERHDLIRQVQPVGRHRAAGDDGGD